MSGRYSAEAWGPAQEPIDEEEAALGIYEDAGPGPAEDEEKAGQVPARGPKQQSLRQDLNVVFEYDAIDAPIRLTSMRKESAAGGQS